MTGFGQKAFGGRGLLETKSSIGGTDGIGTFGIQFEPNGVWVDGVNGSDTTGDGTRGNPYATLTKANTEVDDNRIIYVRSATYNEYLYLPLNENRWQGVGSATIISPDSFGVRLRNDKDLFKNFTINQEVGTGIYGQNTTALEIENCKVSASVVGILSDFLSVENCTIQPSTALTIGISCSGGSQDRVIRQTTFDSTSNKITTGILYPDTLGTLTVAGCYFNGDFNRVINFENTTNPITVSDCFFNLEGGNFAFYSDTSVNDITITRCEFNIVTGNEAPVDVSNQSVNDLIVTDNKLISSATFLQPFITATESNLDAQNNILDRDGTTSTLTDIGLDGSSATSVNLYRVKNNKVFFNKTGGYHFSVGSENTSSFDNLISNIDISQNYVRGNNIDNPSVSNICHGVFVGFQIDADVKYNYMRGTGYGVLFKGDGASTVYTTNGAAYNLITEFNRGVYLKGVGSVNVVNNTLFTEFNAPEYGISIEDNLGSDVGNNNVIKNNIFINLTDTDFTAIRLLDGTTGNDIDHNIYYSPHSDLIFQVGATTYTFAEWQALGNDTNSVVLTDEQYSDLFNNPSAGDFSLSDNSVAVGFGEDLGVSYNTGLSNDTIWLPDDRQNLQTISTQIQPTNWSVGAYIN